MEIAEILPISKWLRFESDVFERFGMDCKVQDINGLSITGKFRWSNKLCPKIKNDDNSRAAICSPSNQYFMATAEKTGKPVIGECDAGFIKLAVPIFVDGEFLGIAGGCGLLAQDGEIETFMITKTLGLSEEEILDLSRGIKVMKKSECNKMVEYIEQFVRESASAATFKKVASG